MDDQFQDGMPLSYDFCLGVKQKPSKMDEDGQNRKTKRPGTPPETNSSHLKMDGCNTSFLLG